MHRLEGEVAVFDWKNPKTPMGTVLLIIVFAIVTIALWTNAYLVMLSRGVTQ